MMRSWWHGRRTAGVVVSALLVSGLAGCGTEPKAVDSNVNFDVKQPAGAAAKPGDAAPVVTGYEEMPTPPAGAMYTIFCQAYQGPDHQVVARRARDLLRANTTMGKWYVVHGADQSTLYYGFYRSVDRGDGDDPAEAQRAIADLNAIRTLHDKYGNRLFPASLPVSINSPNPDANPAWDITKTGAYWSLCIATYKDVPDRKQQAVNAVKEARAQGIDAYYYHGDQASDVCIGAWPKAAAAEIDVADQNPDPTKSLVVTQTPMSDEAKKGLDPNVQAVAPQVDPVDPSMIAAIAQWPAHAVNGIVQMQPDPVDKSKPSNIPLDRAFLFRIPDAVSGVNGQRPAADDSGPTMTAAPTAPAGSGALRSLDDSH
jgi:hypothetical protein